MTYKEKKEEVALIAALKRDLPALKELLREDGEDEFYRFYHQSFKVYYLQETTIRIVKALQSLAPDLKLNDWFVQIVNEGTGKDFHMSDNACWLERTRPILEAFFHARRFLEFACHYAEVMQEPPDLLPSGWAAFLYLYNLR